MRLETEAEIYEKIQSFASRMSSRAPETLARFIASLAVDPGIGTESLCEHVQTFIVGDNLSEETDSQEAYQLQRATRIRPTFSSYRAAS